MPVIQANPYDTAEQILQLARSISNDAATSNGIAGDILADDQPYTFAILNACYRDLQDDLISESVETFSKYGTILGITPTTAPNQRTNVSITYTGYWDGTLVNGDIALPPDLLKPLELWQSPNGNNSWWPMRQVPDSIASRSPAPIPGVWDYQNDTLILPGSTQIYDLKLKYLCYAPDLTDGTSIVYVLHCQTALANMVAASISSMLGGVEMVQIYNQNAEKAKNKIVNRSARKEAYTSFQRLPFRARHQRPRNLWGI